MSGFISDAVPAYRLRPEDLEDYLRRIFPDYTDFKVQVCLADPIWIRLYSDQLTVRSLHVMNITSQFRGFCPG
jgi:hypothetical protein